MCRYEAVSVGGVVFYELYRIATLNCGEEDFAVACMRANLRYVKDKYRFFSFGDAMFITEDVE